MTQAKLLKELECNTHILWGPEFVDEVNDAFNTKVECRAYIADGYANPKGLTLNDPDAHQAVGLSSWELAMGLCSSLGVKYAPMTGRGFQVRACAQALREAGYGAS